MLLTGQILECYGRAAIAKRNAERTYDLASKAHFLEMERRWLDLARSYEFTEQLSRFTEPLKREEKVSPLS